MCPGHEVLMEVDDNNSSLIVADPLGILDQQLRHPPIHLLSIRIIIKTTCLISYFKLLK
jgi:hypothetical protein